MNNCTFINNYQATSSLDNSIFFAIFDNQISINDLIVTNNSFASLKCLIFEFNYFFLERFDVSL